MTGNGPDWLLVSDIDDTLTGDAAALRALVAAVDAAPDRLAMALNSSRPSASVDRTLATEFPEGFRPRAIITAMGTEIRVDGAPLPGWAERFADWPRARIDAIVTGLGFAPHAAEFQTPAKASFAVPGPQAQAMVLRALEAKGLAVRAIASGDSDLDLLPPGAGKDAATLFLAQYLGIAAERVIAAGDSANDAAMFKVAGRAIAVGNARDELLAVMPRDTGYRARAFHAAGVLEGLRALGILPG